MKACDVVIGMKVIPHRKSVSSNLRDCVAWQYARKNQGYLYVIGKGVDPHHTSVFFLDSVTADAPSRIYYAFLAKDFNPYPACLDAIKEKTNAVKITQKEKDRIFNGFLKWLGFI